MATPAAAFAAPAAPGANPPGYQFVQPLVGLNLDPVQKATLAVHAADLRHTRRAQQQREGKGAHDTDRARNSTLYSFARSLFTTGQGIIFALLSNPSAPLTDPIGFVYGCFMYAIVFSALVALQAGLGIIKVFHLELAFRWFGEKYAGGVSIVNWGGAEMFNSKATIVRARDVLGSGPPPHCHTAFDATQDNEYTSEVIEHNMGSVRTKFFDLDCARAFLLMSAIMYERKEEWVQRAVDYKAWSEVLLLKSEETIYEKGNSWGVRFTSISDFVSVAGSFTGAFYSAPGAKEDPWVVVVFKGTSPESLREWLIDATFAKEDAKDYLWGAAHQGFYSTLFPANGHQVPFLPYRRIYEALGAIGRQLSHETGGKKVNLWVSGHSLGAGLASLFYSRLLTNPPPKSDYLVLRDGYVFGCPAVGDAQFCAGFEKAMNEHRNGNKSFFRISNDRDIVAKVPPGLATNRVNRMALNPQSLLNFGQLGTELHLSPSNTHAPFFHLHANTQPGTEILVVEDVESSTIDYELFGLRRKWNHPLSLLLEIEGIVPWIADHAPPAYWSSLAKMQGDMRPGQNDPKFSHGQDRLGLPPQATTGEEEGIYEEDR